MLCAFLGKAVFCAPCLLTLVAEPSTDLPVSRVQRPQSCRTTTPVLKPTCWHQPRWQLCTTQQSARNPLRISLSDDEGEARAGWVKTSLHISLFIPYSTFSFHTCISIFSLVWFRGLRLSQSLTLSHPFTFFLLYKLLTPTQIEPVCRTHLLTPRRCPLTRLSL